MTHFVQRLFQAPKQSFFLFGPRGVGKSTLIKRLYPDALHIDLLEPNIERQLRAKPERLSAMINITSQPKVILIDEVQKVPAVLSVVHKLIEEDKSLLFILAGSNARKLKRSEADLLGGRALRCTLHPFIASELTNDFSIQKALQQGLLPLVWGAGEPETTLETYVNMYVKEEIQQEGLVRNLDDFVRFLESISFSHASLLNISNVARESEVKRKTVESYVKILEDLLIAYQIPVFNKRAKRELIKTNKFYFFDVGVFKTIRPRGPLDLPDAIMGAALEGLIAQHLRAWTEYRLPRHQLYFWQTKGGLEVDFIIYGEQTFAAIEVKHAGKISYKELRGLREFSKDYPQAKLYLVYQGETHYKEAGIEIIPCVNFLLALGRYLMP